MRYLSVLFFLLLTLSCQAASQDWVRVRREAEAVVRRDLAGQEIVLRWDAASPPVLPVCRDIDYQWPGKARGKVFITVRCRTGQRWVTRLPAWISVVAPRAFAREALARDHVLAEADLEWRTVELALYPEDSIATAQQILGHILKQGVQPGQALRINQLRAAFAVHRQQQVRIRVVSASFSIASEGVAQSDAADGERVRVRVASGQIIEGVARPGGLVEITP